MHLHLKLVNQLERHPSEGISKHHGSYSVQEDEKERNTRDLSSGCNPAKLDVVKHRNDIELFYPGLWMLYAPAVITFVFVVAICLTLESEFPPSVIIPTETYVAALILYIISFSLFTVLGWNWRWLQQLLAKFIRYLLDKIPRKVPGQQEDEMSVPTSSYSSTEIEDRVALSSALEKEIGPEGGKLQIGRHKIAFPPGALDSAKMIKIEVLLENDVIDLPKNFIPISHLIECRPGNIHFNKIATFTIPVWFRVFHKSPLVFAFIYKHSKCLGWECIVKLELGHSDTISFGCSHFCKFVALVQRNDVEAGKFFIDHLLCANRFMFISHLCVSEPALIENLIEWAKQSGYKILYPPGNEISVKLGQRTKISLTSKEPAKYDFEPDSQSFLVKEFPTQKKTKSISFLLQNIQPDPLKIVKLVYQVGHDKYFVATDIGEPPKVYPRSTSAIMVDNQSRANITMSGSHLQVSQI